MKTEILQAVRLTREGRLAEATALIQASLASHRIPISSDREGLEVSPTDVAPSSRVSAPLELRPSPIQVPADQQTPAQDQTGGPALILQEPAHPLASVAGLSTLGKLSARKRFPRQLPVEIVAPAAGQWLARAYSDENGSRAYKLYVPSGYHGEALGLVVMLHGCTQSADDFAAGTRMNFLAETNRLLAIYPEQAASANSSRCWNWFLPSHQKRAQGEPALIAGITRQVMTNYHVNVDQVFIAGMSAGGAMAAVVAVVYPELYAAVGVHSGVPPGSAHDLPSALQVMKRAGQRAESAAACPPVPLILFHGDRDATVHPSNAQEFIRQWTGALNQSAVNLRQGQANGGRPYCCAVFEDVSGRSFVESWTIQGARHAWSGGAPNGSFTDPAGPDASRELLRFFQEHPRRTKL